MAKRLNSAVLVFSGYNQRAVISFVRTLEKRKLIYGIIAKSANDPIFMTNYRTKVVDIRRTQSLNKYSLSKCIEVAKNKINCRNLIIAPSTEALNRYLLKERSYFENNGCIIPLIDAETYKLISDKKSFSDLCRKNGIFVPKEYEFKKSMRLPYVAKPQKYLSPEKKKQLVPLIIDSDLKQAEFIAKYRIGDFYFQEFISGESFYLLYYFGRNGEIYKYSQKNIAQQADGKSIVAAVSNDFHLSDESGKYERLFKKLDYFGFVMVEVREKGGKHYMIEANPRFWGPSQLFVDAGINLFDAFLYDYCVHKVKPKMKVRGGAKYFWLGGIIGNLRENKKIVIHGNNEYEFWSDLHSWLNWDVYRRKDTINIFKGETS
jgi:predicted ATP-grasp superfamily ATP-dependent carboligase